jgi:predicted dehydrogenase
MRNYTNQPESEHMRTHRREFLRKSAAAISAAASLALPTIVSPRVFGNTKAAPPSDRVRLGFIGVGNQGGQNVDRFLKMLDRVDIVALCDVDSSHLAEIRTRVEGKTKKKCAAYGDYRKLLENKDVDGVVITTPDHWHALATIDACRAGKDVYCEKPLSLTIAEGRAMVNASRATKRIVQTGSQQRSAENFRRACELVRSGRLGKIHTVKVGIAGVNFGKKKPIADSSSPPPELDYDFWLGPAPFRPYHPRHVHYNFRFFWDYSGGQMTNWGAHHLDIAQWGLGMDDSGPVKIEGKARYNAEKLFEVPEWCEVHYEYANGVKIICGQSQKGGTTFEGENGSIYVSRNKLEANPADILKSPAGESDVHLYESADHHGNWLDCIHSRELPICDVEIGHRSATVCHLGNIAIRSQKTVHWDPATEKVIGDEEIARMTSRPYRAPWSLPLAAQNS